MFQKALNQISNSGLDAMNLTPLVPTMTSYTAPSGRVFGNGAEWSNAPYWYIFNGVETTGDKCAAGSSVTDSYIGYEFTRDVIPKVIYIMNETETPVYLGKFRIEGSNGTDTDWEVIAEFTNPNQGVVGAKSVYWLNNDKAYRKLAIHNLTAGSGGVENHGWAIVALQYYGFNA